LASNRRDKSLEKWAEIEPREGRSIANHIGPNGSPLHFSAANGSDLKQTAESWEK